MFIEISISMASRGSCCNFRLILKFIYFVLMLVPLLDSARGRPVLQGDRYVPTCRNPTTWDR